MEAFKDYAYYYNAFYREKDYASEVRQVECTGIDISSDMIEVAKANIKKENMNINVSVADIRHFEPQEKSDAVISLFHVMSYQNKNQDILLAFQSARKSLEKEGLFLFDVWYGPGVLSDKPVVRVKDFEDEKYRLVRIARPVMHDKENTVDVCYEIFVIDKATEKVKVIHEIHSMRYFFRPELEILLNEAGFELIHNIDCRTLRETDFNSWTSFFIARAV